MQSTASSHRDPSRPAHEDQGAPASPHGPERPAISKRHFFKLLLAGALGIGTSQALGRTPAEASYQTGPPDTVTTDLTIQGNLVINNSLAIGTTAAPQGRVDVRGDLWNENVPLIGSDGCGKQCYYVQGPVVEPPPATTAGSWGRIRVATWGAMLEAPATPWGQASSTNGTWDRIDQFTWSQLAANSWNHLDTL